MDKPKYEPPLTRRQRRKPTIDRLAAERHLKLNARNYFDTVQTLKAEHLRRAGDNE